MTAQSAFRAALLDPELPAPEGLGDPAGRPAPRRFAVYRNNVAVGLTEALRAGFPLLRSILGAEFFDALAGAFLRAHPPSSPLLMHYGAEMPDFLAGFGPVRHLGYLPDVARLELGLRAAYHAADAQPLRGAALAGKDLMSCALRLAPATRIIASQWPLYGIWRFNTAEGAPRPGSQPEAVLITRPLHDPVVTRLDHAGAEFVSRLLAGETLGAAVAEAGQGFDPGPALQALLAGNAIVSMEEPRP